MRTTMHIKDVEIASLKPTVAFRESRVARYIEMLARPSKKQLPMPPIIVNSKLEIQDGHHRVEAWRRSGRTHIPARIIGA